MKHTAQKLAVAGSVVAGALLAASPAQASPHPYFSDILDAYWSGDNLHFFECWNIRHASPVRMPRCMQSDNVLTYLEDFQTIADENQGNRASGLSGYDATVDYVVQQLTDMGYRVTRDAFDFNAFYELGDGELSALSPTPTDYVWQEDFNYLSQTEAGNVSGTVQAVDLDLGPDNSSSSGCEIEDFADFNAGNIALIQRGACTFAQKAENAAASGAVGAIIFNQGNSDDRTGLISATLGADYIGGIPAFFATYDNGVAWSETDGLVLSMMADVLRETRTVENVITETRRGNDDNVVMLGAHLDSVQEGPGIQDNGSGSAALLEMAYLMRKAKTHNKVRFAWWGAEEAGLVGSTSYVQRLSDEEKARIKVYLNFDMIASPNAFYGIYDGDGSEFGLEGPAGSGATEAMFEKYFDLRGEPFEGSEISFRSDYAEFFLNDIAFGGLFTGAEQIKTEEQAEIYGGEAGVAFDPCYHAECDDIDNLNLRALEVNADAIAFVTSVFAHSTWVIDEEIEAAEEETEPSVQSFSAAAASSAYDITHWGKYWIK
ncbi:M28 family metallopeptidase [Saccharospirillum salsuginis]|uniref:Aminopeptidase n=1 Tax=Saccharospirillum salsuginis TaxID=418750 RepID=A0A918NHI0_9GAMM|nr:M28 family metallopeptidase [Saccharospirillum salsuginis]GGX67617.1 aminopeptidase [Saccharospirillum salsuginis]